jgi:hypothetical protein
MTSDDLQPRQCLHTHELKNDTSGGAALTFGKLRFEDSFVSKFLAILMFKGDKS